MKPGIESRPASGHGGAVAWRRVARRLAVVLSLLAASASAAPAQDELPAGARERHDENVRLERRLAWMDAWDTASPEVRTDALAMWRVMLSRGSRAAGSPPSAMVGRMIRILVHGERAARAERSECLVADNIDLRVVPGAFEAREEGSGEALVVHVRPLDRLAEQRSMPDRLRLSLLWVAPSGEEQLARSEPFGRKAFGGAGFEMYVRPPISAPGVWRLVPLVSVGPHEARGIGVAVECVERLHERYAAYRASRDASAPTSAYDGGLIERLEHGVRDLTLPSIDALLAGRTGARRSEMAPGAEPHPTAGWSSRGADSWVLDPPAGATGVGELLISLAGPREAPAWLFAGAAGQAWAGYSRDRGARIVSLDYSFTGSEGRLWRLIADERERQPDATVTLVARASSLLALSFELQREECLALVERVVFVSPIVRDQPPAMQLQRPWLYLEPLGEDSRDELVEVEGGEPGHWARRPAPMPIAELELPGLLRRTFD